MLHMAFKIIETFFKNPKLHIVPGIFSLNEGRFNDQKV